jgi:hypothetical protein
MRNATVRLLLAALLASLAMRATAQTAVFANGFEPRRFCDLAAGPTVCPGFSIAAPDFMLAPGEIATRSFYFRSPNAATLVVRRLAATRSNVVAQLLLMTTVTSSGPQECRPAGTFEGGQCCEGAVGPIAIPLLAAQRPTDDLFFSSTDGSGVALALEIQPDQPLCLQITGVNPDVDPVTASASVRAEAQLPALPHVATAPLWAVTSLIDVPSPSIGTTVSHQCATRAGTQFWWLSTRTFGHAIEARLSRGANPLLINTDWAAPQAALFEAPGFVGFNTMDPLVTACTYVNMTGQPIRFGTDPQLDDTCEALGWFFPATAPAACANGLPVLP